MTRTETRKKDRAFTVELKTKSALKSASLDSGGPDGVMVEGTLGTLVRATFQDEVVLEVAGTKGTLRVDLTDDEISAEPARSPLGSDDGGRDR
ncbi:MAG TPA: hypothetical protein VGB78_03455 [Thermoplasmata archaeon]